jgi:hypothetical protein
VQSKSEELTFQICRRSFLSLWSYPNPRGGGTSELCDVLVVCDPNIIIISVKDIGFKHQGDPETQALRWYRRAVLKQVKQVYGAEHWIQLDRHDAVIRSDGTEGVPFPPKDRRRIHRVVIAIGGAPGIPLPFGHFGKGNFVHVFNDTVFDTLLRTLDTITDFTDYLTAKEKLFHTSPENVACDHELDLLAWYLGDARSLSLLEPIVPLQDAWEHFQNSPQFQAKQKADEDSYLWDFIIETVSHDIAERTFEVGEESLSENEQIVRVMAREPRLARRVLSQSLWQFLDRARTDGWASRMVQSSLRGVGYVFLARNASTSKELRAKELRVRCFIARAMLPNVEAVLGLATETPGTAPHISWVVTCFKPETWQAHDQMFALCLSRLSGMFAEVHQQLTHEQEFPSIESVRPEAGA